MVIFPIAMLNYQRVPFSLKYFSGSIRPCLDQPHLSTLLHTISFYLSLFLVIAYYRMYIIYFIWIYFILFHFMSFYFTLFHFISCHIILSQSIIEFISRWRKPYDTKHGLKQQLPRLVGITPSKVIFFREHHLTYIGKLEIRSSGVL